ncbi:MAG: hypothetical protein ACOC28_03520 [Alkalispirochaetaceae bacterium]
MKTRTRSPRTLLLVATLFVLSLIAAPAVVAQGLDWGGTIDGSGSATFADHLDDPDTDFSASVALWLATLFEPSETAAIEVTLQPSYTWADDRPYLVDLDRAVADMRFGAIAGPGSVLRGRAGRFPLSDASGLIISDTGDGADFTLSVAGIRVRVAGAYTGLLLNPVSNFRMSAADEADAGDDDLFFGPARILATSEIAFPEIVGRETLTLAYIGQFDLRDPEEGEDTINSHYVGLRADGPIIPGLFHQVSTFFSFADEELDDESDDDLGILGSLRVTYFRPDWLSSSFGLRGVVITGISEEDDNFHTISDQQASTVATIPGENVAYGEFTYGLKPLAGAQSRVFRDIQTTLGSRVLFRIMPEQPVDSFGASVTSEGQYIGTEATFTLGWRILSDLGTSLTGGIFLPGTGSSGVFTDQRETEYLVRMQASASF